MNDFIIKDTIDKGKSLFTTVNFESNQILFRFEGQKISFEESKNLPNSDRFLQIGKELYLNMEKHFGVFSNHSCNPNCYVSIAVNTAFLISSRPIKAGDEILFDYSLTSTEIPETWSMPCNCSLFGCRKLISGFGLLPKEQQKSLIIAGKVSKYIIEIYT